MASFLWRCSLNATRGVFISAHADVSRPLASDDLNAFPTRLEFGLRERRRRGGPRRRDLIVRLAQVRVVGNVLLAVHLVLAAATEQDDDGRPLAAPARVVLGPAALIDQDKRPLHLDDRGVAAPGRRAAVRVSLPRVERQTTLDRPPDVEYRDPQGLTSRSDLAVPRAHGLDALRAHVPYGRYWRAARDAVAADERDRRGLGGCRHGALPGNGRLDARHDTPSTATSIAASTAQFGSWQFAQCSLIAALRSAGETAAHIARTFTSWPSTHAF